MNYNIFSKITAIFVLENDDTNGCTDGTDFTDWYGFFGIQCLVLGKKNKKIRTNP
jgi:hypothetical protein